MDKLKKIAIYGHFGRKEAMRLCYAYKCLEKAEKSGPVAHAMLAIKMVISDHSTADIEQTAEACKQKDNGDRQSPFMSEL